MHSQTEFPIIVAAGGTGGDLFPVFAIVQELQQLVKESHGCILKPIFIGNNHRIEGRVVPARGYHFVSIPMQGYYGMRSMRTYSLSWRLPYSLMIVHRVIHSHKPRLILGAGTYITIPAGIMATWHRLPLVLLEINARPGKANTLLAHYATRILVGSEQCRSRFPSSIQSRIIVTGIPVRQELCNQHDPLVARMRLGLDPHRPVLLVLGGSLGARSINIAVEPLIPRIRSLGWQILWQTGNNYHHRVCDGVVALPFIDDMASAYAAADLVISRAGASTIAELAMLAKPAILVPYPLAANHEQEHNARLLVEAGGALLLADDQLDHRLWTTLEPLIKDHTTRSKMARALERILPPDSTQRAAEAVAELLFQ